MLIRSVILTACMAGCFNSYSQDMNSIWIFGDSAGIDFSNINNPTPITSGMDGRGSCVSIGDSTGNLLFYAYTREGGGDWTTTVKNFLGDSIQGADSITGEAWYNELSIIPFPDVPKRYYLFSVGLDIPNNAGLYYSVIDMNANAGLGQVLQQNIQVADSGMADCIASIKHGNGRDWWVISKLTTHNIQTYLNRFYVVLITPDSVYAPIVQDLGGARDGDIQKMIFKESGDRFMLINRGGYMGEYHFDRCSGQISFLRLIFPPGPYYFWEGAYSANGNVFYVSTSDIFNRYLIQYDLSASYIPFSADTLESFQGLIGTGALRLAPDGKIYFSRAYEDYPCCAYTDTIRNYINQNLSVINTPDSLGAACNYQSFSFNLGGNRTYNGLPNNPNYSLGRLIGSACDTLYTNIAEQQVNRLSVYPNPARRLITVSLPGAELANVRFSIFNSLGELIISGNFGINPTVDVSRLRPGIYLLTSEQGSKTYYAKIAVE